MLQRTCSSLFDVSPSLHNPPSSPPPPPLQRTSSAIMTFWINIKQFESATTFVHIRMYVCVLNSTKLYIDLRRVSRKCCCVASNYTHAHRSRVLITLCMNRRLLCLIWADNSYRRRCSAYYWRTPWWWWGLLCWSQTQMQTQENLWLSLELTQIPTHPPLPSLNPHPPAQRGKTALTLFQLWNTLRRWKHLHNSKTLFHLKFD